MQLISTKAIDFIECGLSEMSADAIGESFFRVLQPLGVRGVYSFAYAAASAEGQIYSRISPPGWQSLYTEKKFENANCLRREAGRRAECFRWSDVAAINDDERALTRALIDFGCPDGLGVPCHGPSGYLGVVSLAFERPNEISPAERQAMAISSMVLHNRMRALSPPAPFPVAKLSRRERDCIGFVAQGKSDWEISVILRIGHTTVISHMQNAKRKLGVATRAQAVARCFTEGLL